MNDAMSIRVRAFGQLLDLFPETERKRVLSLLRDRFGQKRTIQAAEEDELDEVCKVLQVYSKPESRAILIEIASNAVLPKPIVMVLNGLRADRQKLKKTELQTLISRIQDLLKGNSVPFSRSQRNSILNVLDYFEVDEA